MPSSESRSGRLLRHVKRAALPVAALSIFLFALYFLHHELAGISWNSILASMKATSAAQIAAAIGLTLLSYFLLTGYDWLALRYVDRPLPYSRVALTGFMAYAIGNNVGVSAISGGSVRYRVYSLLGLSGIDIAKVIAFCASTFVLGAALVIGAALWTVPAHELHLLPLGNVAQKLVGAGLMLVPAAYVGFALVRPAPLRLSNWSLDFPHFGLAAAQVAIAVADLVCVAGVLYVLLAPEVSIGFLEFTGIYVIAMAAGVLSSVPGGVGVVESVLVLGLPTADRTALLGSILLFRLVYYIAPLSLGLLLLSAHEVHQARSHIARVGVAAADWLTRIVPAAIGSLVFLGGGVLLLSGATPALDARLQTIDRWLPLPLIELSHLLASLLGVVLLVVARGLSRRLHGAYVMALSALLAGAAAALAKGLNLEEAAVLVAIAAGLWAARREFHRGGSLLDQQFPAAWVVSIVMAAAVAIWWMLFSFGHLGYNNALWWQFALDAQAPRALRATLVAGLALGVFALWKLLRPAAPAAAPVNAQTSDRLRTIIAGAADSIANVALLGDKRILLGPSGDAFIMYQVRGRSWIALGDPVGPREEWEELIWRYRETCDRYDGLAAFYQVTPETLSLYIDAGFSISKLGEVARVPLGDFDLAGNRYASLRHAHNRALREGASFEVVRRERVPAIMAELRLVSDDWLGARSAHEKGFSLGAFNDAYIASFDCAVVRTGGRVVAFANLWPAPAAGEIAVDLMRYHHDAPSGTMDYLFIEIMLWAQAQGFAWFGLGMAPLSGLDTHPLAPLWHKIGHLIYQHGEAFYNFEGLRAYKEKFDPVWESRYLAAPNGLKTPQVLKDASILIAGGVRELLAR